jgi:serine/threonine-protein kinase RsbW
MTVPARPEVAQVIRAVVGSVASRLNFAYDEIDDLRLAASEVVAHLLEEIPPPTSLIARVSAQDGTVEVVVARTTSTDVWPPTGARHSLTTLILRALADEASFDRTDDGPAIRFTKRLGSQAAATP